MFSYPQSKAVFFSVGRRGTTEEEEEECYSRLSIISRLPVSVTGSRKGRILRCWLNLNLFWLCDALPATLKFEGELSCFHLMALLAHWGHSPLHRAKMSQDQSCHGFIIFRLHVNLISFKWSLLSFLTSYLLRSTTDLPKFQSWRYYLQF